MQRVSHRAHAACNETGNSTGTNKYFDKVVCVSEKRDKAAWFKRLTHISDLPPYVINDDPTEGKLVSAHLAPHTEHILVERPTAKYTNIAKYPGYKIHLDLGEVKLTP